ncbi:2-oxoacid:acceptor oxidoreductase family protein [Myxococcota bacterium]|nr:2-oxoacid:acceptor oxidoreductase family protein [Myxococcota bacterium]
MARVEIRIGGLGGQGVILSGILLGRAASIHDGRHATLIQAFGPEARGSACSAQVTIDDVPVDYPYVRQPDILVVMSPDAYQIFASQVKPGGILLYEEDLVTPGPGLPEGVRCYGVPATRIAEELGRRLVLNIVMVGFFVGVTGVVSRDAAEQALMALVPKGTETLNREAFLKGLEYGLATRGRSDEGRPGAPVPVLG